MPATKPSIVILNMAYTGLGIARNLRKENAEVFGVTSKTDLPGNRTRFARILQAPDSAENPADLSTFLIDLAASAKRPVLFGTRDQDVHFIEQFRDVLEPYYRLPIPAAGVLSRLLDKWETAQLAKAVNIPVPLTYQVRSLAELESLALNLQFPCVVKPISAAQWRGKREWKLIGERKAFAVHNRQQLLYEYRVVSGAAPDVLIQELIPGPDSNLYTFGCYLNRDSELKGSFYGRKVLQYPVGFGTGFVVKSEAPSEVRELSIRLLQSLRYCGIAECEFKFDERDRQMKLIEVNPRHWDQHVLSTACGVNLSQLAYRDMCGFSLEEQEPRHIGTIWVAEDSFLCMGGRMVFDRQLNWSALLRSVRGRRVYGLFMWTDPVPFVYMILTSLLPRLLNKLRALFSAVFYPDQFRPPQKSLGAKATAKSRETYDLPISPPGE